VSQTVTLRLPDETAEWLRATARRTGHSVNKVGIRLLEESRRTSEFTGIGFRSFGAERHACIKGDLQVWQLIEVARQYGMDPERTAAHFDWPVWRVLAGFHYCEAFPEEIDAAIAENQSMGFEKLKRLFRNWGRSQLWARRGSAFPSDRRADILAVAAQIKTKRPEIRVESLRSWQGGAFVGVSDEVLLHAAAQSNLTLITYDQKTIPPILVGWAQIGRHHGGVIFTDHLTIAQSDIGGLVRAIIAHWDAANDWDWTDRIDYLRAATP
jgi:hypothetical protein